MNPKVSIIVPTFNRADFLAKAVESALLQTFTDFELIILDDASTDQSLDTISPYLEDGRILIIQHPRNIGITANRNYGLSVARGRYIAMLDSDDVWLDPGKLQRQTELLDTDDDCGLVGTFAEILDGSGRITGRVEPPTEDAVIRKYLLVRNPIVHSSVLLRKKILDQAGRYDESIPIWEDYDLWLRMGGLCTLRNIGEPMTGYRKHSSNISRFSEYKSILSYRKIYQRHRRAYPYSGVFLMKIYAKSALYFLRHGAAA